MHTILELLGDAEFWVAVAFVIFVAGLGYLGVHRMVAKSLDERADRIKAELDEARKLKDEAAKLLADYQRKRQEAEGEAQEIIAGADVRSAAAEAAVAAAENILSRETKGSLAAELIAKGIADVRKKLN